MSDAPPSCDPSVWDSLGAYLLWRWPAARLYRYSCSACFEALWAPLLGGADSCSCWTNSARRVALPPSPYPREAGGDLRFVAYDGAPQGYVRPRQYPTIHLDTLFSPAAAWALTLTARTLSETLVVIDPLARATPEERAVGRLLGDRLTHLEGGAGVPSLEGAAGNPPLVTAALELLRGHASRPGHRHAVANLLGAMILGQSLPEPQGRRALGLRGVPAADGPDVGPALRQVVDSLGLLPRPRGAAASGHWFARQHWRPVLDTFLVLDDMHECGWGNFLYRALQVHELPAAQLREERDGGVLSVFAGKNTSPLLRLTDSPDTGFGADGKSSVIDVLARDGGLRRGEPLRFCNPSGREALFLDLRLFAVRPVEDEINFYDQLLFLAAGDEVRPGPAGELFTPGRLKALREWLRQAQKAGRYVEDDNYYQFLTLLPRLVALADPLLPVVLFSSTGQRQVLELLRDYPSIVTEFDKPRFFGVVPDETVTASRERFDAALRRCVHLARGRAALCALFDEDVERGRSPPKLTDPFTLAEIYLDETGNVDASQEFCVGGIALLYKARADADRLDRELRMRHLTWGLAEGFAPKKDRDPFPSLGKYLAKVTEPITLPCHRYAPDPHNPLDHVSRQTTDDDYYREGLKLVADALQACQVRVLLFGLVEKVAKLTLPAHQQELLDERSLDFCYRSMLGEVVESVVFDVLLPLYQGGGKLEVAVDAATRSYVKPGSKTQIDQWWRQFAVDRGGRGDGFESLKPDHFHPLVTEMLARRRGVADRVQVQRARAVRLCDYATLAKYRSQRPRRFAEVVTQRESPRPRQVHYLADWVTRLIAERGPSSTVSPLASLLGPCGDGIRQRRDDSFQSWLRSGRAATRGELSVAVAEAAWAWEQEAQKAEVLKNGLARWMLPQARSWVGRLTGREFMAVCDHLPPL